MVAPEQGMTDTLILMNEHSAVRAMRAWMQTAYATTSRSSFKCKCNLLHLRPRGERACRAQLCFCCTGYFRKSVLAEIAAQRLAAMSASVYADRRQHRINCRGA